MPKPNFIELGNGERIPIVYEDRSVIAIDKPAGWMLVPVNWQQTRRNLQTALLSSIASGAFWAKSRDLRFLRYIHRLDGETTGVLLFAKSRGALDTFGALFESRRVTKLYLAVVLGTPEQREWVCKLALGPDKRHIGRVIVDAANGKEAFTRFRSLSSRDGPSGKKVTLIDARPVTGRTHQIRVHLAAHHLPILGDPLYGKSLAGVSLPAQFPMALRAVRLVYKDPFTYQWVTIDAPYDEFLQTYGFSGANLRPNVSERRAG